MILLKLKNGWPDTVASWDHSGTPPSGHVEFASLQDLDAWKEANSHLRPAPDPQPDPVPDIIPMWAFRRSLRKKGMLAGILSFIDSLPEQQKLDAMEHLEYGNYIERSHPMIFGSAKQLGLPDAVVDQIFKDGSKEK